MEIRQEAESVPTRKIALVGLLAVLISAVLVVVAWWMEARAPARAPTRPVPAEVSNIEATLWPGPESGVDQHARQRLHLDQYGWIDRRRQLIHIPIERAMRLYVDRRRQGGGR